MLYCATLYPFYIADAVGRWLDGRTVLGTQFGGIRLTWLEVILSAAVLLLVSLFATQEPFWL